MLLVFQIGGKAHLVYEHFQIRLWHEIRFSLFATFFDSGEYEIKGPQ